METYSTARAACASEAVDDHNSRDTSALRNHGWIVESDDEHGASNPIYDAFYDSGMADCIVRMTNFSPREFREIYESVADYLRKNWNSGTGRKVKHTAFDVMFMVCFTLKCSASWEFTSELFGIRADSFRKLIKNFMTVIYKELYEIYVSETGDSWNKKALTDDGMAFRRFPCALCAVDVKFQEANRPDGSLHVVKPYYSGKHHLYGYKTEISVAPCGIAISCSPHVPAATSDFTVFNLRTEWHKNRSEKSVLDEILPDDGPLHSRYDSFGAILADKGYQGAADLLRVVSPKKNPARGRLSLEDESTDRHISSDKILIENYFGRLCSLWKIMAGKYRWREDSYDMIIQICVALTNCPVSADPLRRRYGDLHGHVRGRTHDTGLFQMRARQQLYEETRALKRQRLSQSRQSAHISK